MTSNTRSAQLGVGIIGGGFMAAVHSRAARTAGARLIGVASSSPSRANETATRLGFPKGYESVVELLADDEVDVVHVCTPNAFHAEQALAAIQAGKHVICEKPIGVTAAEAEVLVSAANAANLTATVPFVYRFHPMVREARARLREGKAGELLTISGAYLQDWLLESSDDNWRVDVTTGGSSRAFADIGSHLVDLLEFITGQHIARLTATKRTFIKSRTSHPSVATEDAVALALEMSGGGIGSLVISQVSPGRKNQLRLEIAGSEASIAFDQENPESLWVGRRVGSELLPRDPVQLHSDAARLCIVPAGHPQGYQDAFTAFVSDSYTAIMSDAPDGLPVFADGLRTAQITEAVMTSCQMGRWVSVEPSQMRESSK